MRAALSSLTFLRSRNSAARSSICCRRTAAAQPKDGDFIWDLSFNFGPTDFPDGSTGKGTLIQCRDFYGNLRVFTAIDGKTLRCTTSEQEAFLQQVYDIVSLEP